MDTPVIGGQIAPTVPSNLTLLDAIAATVAYADIFDFALTAPEIHRDLIGVATGPEQTDRAIETLVATGELVQSSEYVVLPRREDLIQARQPRRERAQAMWPVARRVGTILGTFPFVRLIAVTGSLAADNPGPDADLDYLIVTAPGRLWLVRALAVGLVRLGGALGLAICPNYLLTTRALRLDHEDIFTAHELLQAVPIVGRTTYRQLLAQNAWVQRWLPNRCRELPPDVPERSALGLLKRVGEIVMTGPIGDWLESREARRTRHRLSRRSGKARFTADVCEGHYGRGRQRTCQAFTERCARLQVSPAFHSRPNLPSDGRGNG